MSGPGVRRLRPDEAATTARMHREVLHMEFLARCGPGFLAAYHRWWIASPFAIAVAATDSTGRVIGVLLGAVDPAAHYRHMARRGGLDLGLRLAGYAAVHPPIAGELLATRSRRYARALVRLVWAPSPAGTDGVAADGTSPGPAVGEVTHLMVADDAQNRGVGRALLAEAERVARAAGRHELVLVTPPDLAARRVYEHLGWETVGERTSRSGERFVLFRRPLG